jgi:hypothetical protein
MSHVHVERVIGLLATDEGLRERFIRDPHAVLSELIERGMELNPCERHSLARMDTRELDRFANAIDPRLQKADLKSSPIPRGEEP